MGPFLQLLLRSVARGLHAAANELQAGTTPPASTIKIAATPVVRDSATHANVVVSAQSNLQQPLPSADSAEQPADDGSPPAHWLAMVRKQAPGLLLNLQERGVIQSAAATPVITAQHTSSIPTEELLVPEHPQPRTSPSAPQSPTQTKITAHAQHVPTHASVSASTTTLSAPASHTPLASPQSAAAIRSDKTIKTVTKKDPRQTITHSIRKALAVLKGSLSTSEQRQETVCIIPAPQHTADKAPTPVPAQPAPLAATEHAAPAHRYPETLPTSDRPNTQQSSTITHREIFAPDHVVHTSIGNDALQSCARVHANTQISAPDNNCSFPALPDEQEAGATLPPEKLSREFTPPLPVQRHGRWSQEQLIPTMIAVQPLLGATVDKNSSLSLSQKQRFSSSMQFPDTPCTTPRWPQLFAMNNDNIVEATLETPDGYRERLEREQRGLPWNG